MLRFYMITLLNTAALAQPILPIFEIQNEDTLVDNADNKTISLNGYFKAEPIDNEVVRFVARYSTDNLPTPTIVTKNLDFALFSNRTPVTRTNFLQYVNSGAYVNSFIHRGVKNFVIQGGGFFFNFLPNSVTVNPVATLGTIVNEPGISNSLGTISMAKTSLGPNTASNQWFISTNENSSNLDFQNGGFTVFSRLTKDTLPNALLFDNPASFPSYNLTNFIGEVFNETPLHISVQSLVVEKFISFTSVSRVALPANQAGTSTVFTYQIVSQPNNSLATASITGQNLVIVPNGSTTGESSVTIKATDSVGNEVIGQIPIKVGNSYDAWKNNNFAGADLLDPQVSGPNADPNKNGISNLQAFAQGLDANETVYPTTVISPTDILVTYLEQTDTLANRISIQRSTTLQTNDWQTLTGTPISSVSTSKTNQRLVTVSFPRVGDIAFYRLAFEIIPD